jgi:hypothetical protein
MNLDVAYYWMPRFRPAFAALSRGITVFVEQLAGWVELFAKLIGPRGKP